MVSNFLVFYFVGKIKINITFGCDKRKGESFQIKISIKFNVCPVT